MMPDARATSQTRFWKQTRREVKEELVRQQQIKNQKKDYEEEILSLKARNRDL